MSTKKIKPEYRKKHQHNGTEKLLKIDGLPLMVNENDSVEILIYGKEGFSVFIPYHGVFSSQVFEAEEEPAWATALDRQEAMDAAKERPKGEEKLEGVSTQGGGDAEGKSGEAAEEKLWGLRMDRIAKHNEAPIEIMPYCIYSKELHNFALGNSPPKMVVKP